MGIEPSVTTLALHRRIQAAETELGHTLPVQSTSFVGREADLATITSYLAKPDCRLLTLVGPGGIGKTRLAIAAAEKLHQHYLEGAVYVSLLSITAVEGVVSVIAEAMQLEFQEGRPPMEQLLASLRGKELLLVLDNLEQLLGDPAGTDEEHTMVRLIEDILATAAAIKIMVTSREVVNIFAEQVFPVQGLPFANNDETGILSDQPAVELFLSRAQRLTGGDLALNEPALKSIVDICCLVEGMPLAIELAAAQVRLYSPTEIVKNLRKNLDILQVNSRGLNQRHQSMRAVLAVSWRNLPPVEQRLLARCSVFAGGFTRQAAAAIVQAQARQLAMLLDKSLIMGGPGRFTLHALLQQFAAEMLNEMATEKVPVQQRHFDYYRHLLSQAVTEWARANDPAQLDGLRPEVENLRVAWNWINAQEDRQTAISYLDHLWQFFFGRHRYSEAIRYLSLALEQTPDGDANTQFGLLLAREQAYDKEGDREAQVEDLQRLSTVASRLGPQAQGTVALRQATFAETIGEYEQAITHAQAANDTGRQVENKTTLAAGHYLWGKVLHRQGQYTSAEKQFLAGLQVASEGKDQKQIANCYHGLGKVNFSQNKYC